MCAFLSLMRNIFLPNIYAGNTLTISSSKISPIHLKHPVWLLCTIYWKFCVDLCVVDVEITLPVWDIAHHVMRRNVTGVPVWRHIRSKDPLERCEPHGEPSGVGVSKDPPSVPNGKSWQSSQEYQGKHSLGTWKCKSVFYIHCRIIST